MATLVSIHRHRADADAFDDRFDLPIFDSKGVFP